MTGGYVSPQARAEYYAAYDRGFAALPEPAEQFDITTAFGTARVYRFGDLGPAPMMLLHGRSGATVMWQPNLVAFAARGPVYSVDLIGEPGRSEQTAPIRDAADQAAWLEAVMAELDLTGVHLLGYSFGGWLAANQAVRSPRRLASLTVIDPVQTFCQFPVELLWRTALASVPGLRRWGRPSFLRWIADGAETDPDDPVAIVIDAGMRTYRISLPTPRVLTDDELRSISVPVLALIAGCSVMHDGRRAAERAERLLPDACVELWPSATHAIAGEFASEVNQRVLQFLAEVDAAREGSA